MAMATLRWFRVGLLLLLLLLGAAQAWTNRMTRQLQSSKVCVSANSKPYASISTVSNSPLDRAGRHGHEQSPQDLSDLLSDLEHIPKLIVFDLDNTLWTPELYQIRQPRVPIANQEIRLFDGVAQILSFSKASGYTLAIASRTNKVQWAHQLLQDFCVMDETSQTARPLRSFFDYVEIQPGSKKTHFSNMRRESSNAYSDMIFFDDDARLNLHEISSQLGILCVHTPRGITLEHFYKSMLAYDERKRHQQEWMGDILTYHSVPVGTRNSKVAPTTGQNPRQGRVKFYSKQKKFGFVVDNETGQEFFVHESKVPASIELMTGDAVTFEALEPDSLGRASAVVLSSNNGTGGAVVRERSDSAVAASTTMPCFTMSQPFCALLLNGVKTVESRNTPMFMDVKPGTRILLHCGQKDWHDTISYKSILAEEIEPAAIQVASMLPKNYEKGAIVGLVTVGKTWRASDSDRMGSDLQRKVLAPYEGIGKYCTEITSFQWLTKPFKVRGQPGIYTATLPSDLLQS